MKKLIPLFSILLFASCSANLDMVGMFYGQSDRNDARFEQSMEYNQQYGMPTVQSSADDYVVALATDAHIDSTTNNLDTWIQFAQTQPKCPFALFLGDLVNAQGNMPKASERFPNRRPAVWTADMVGENIPFYGTAGNHDLYWGQWTEYRDFWHTSVYTITVTTPSGYKDLFISLDSSDGTLGIKQMNWLRNLLLPETDDTITAATENYRHIIAFTHTHMFMQDASQGHTSNFPTEETYELTSLFQKAGVEMYISGHDHARDITHFKDVEYIIVDALEDHYPNAGYAVLNVANDLNINFIDIE